MRTAHICTLTKSIYALIVNNLQGIMISVVQGCDCNLRTEEGGKGEGCQCRLDTSTIAAMIKMMQTKKEMSAHRHRFAHFVSVCRKLDKIFSLSSSVLSCSQSGVTRIGVTKKYTPIAQKTGNTGK